MRGLQYVWYDVMGGLQFTSTKMDTVGIVSGIHHDGWDGMDGWGEVR